MSKSAEPLDAPSTRDGAPSTTRRGGDGEPKPRLLVVNDDEDHCELMAHRFSQRGFRVETAIDGPTALDAVHDARVDLMLLDMRMPGMDGLEVLSRVREQLDMHDLPVVMASALSDSEAVVQALELGANDYVTLPLDFDVALARIHNLLRSSATAHPSRSSQPALEGSSGGVGATLDDRYRLDALIGAGGFAHVYRATQLSTGQRVAIKLLRDGRFHDEREALAERRRFELEMRLIGEINHPSVVRLLDSGSVLVSPMEVAAEPGATRDVARGDDGQLREPGAERTSATRLVQQRLPYLVMELLQGETLSDALRRRGKLGLEEAVDLLVPIVSGVGAAHARGAIHRDLKPANIFLANAGKQVQPKVLDFGIAKLIDRSARALTQTASMIGTPEYMAPEQASGKPLSVQADQYTLASVLFECLTGRRAFVGHSMIDVVRQVAEGRFPDVAEHVEVPDSLREALLRATALEPSERFESVEAFGVALLPHASEAVRSHWERPLRAGGATLVGLEIGLDTSDPEASALVGVADTLVAASMPPEPGE